MLKMNIENVDGARSIYGAPSANVAERETKVYSKRQFMIRSEVNS